MSSDFNHDFYVTTATVIPLLYITLILQSEQVQKFAKIVGIQYDKFSNKWDGAWGSMKRGENILRNFGNLLLGGIGLYVFPPIMAIVAASALAGVAAEAYSLWALYYQKDIAAMRVLVLWSTLWLLILMCSRPTMIIIRNLMFSYTDELAARRPGEKTDTNRAASDEGDAGD